MKTVHQIATAQMKVARQSYDHKDLIVIHPEDLRELLGTATQMGYELGHEHGVGLGRKLGPLEKVKLRKSMTATEQGAAKAQAKKRRAVPVKAADDEEHDW